MPNNKDIARKLFSIAAADLTELKPETLNEVACPLCLARFGIAAIEDGRLSREHIVPSALGGKLLTLTCRRCNNTLGSDLDRNMINAIKGLGFVAEMYSRAVFRAAYLAAFERLGYPYVFSDAGDFARRVIAGLAPAPPAIFEAFPQPDPQIEAWVIPATKDTPFLLVILQLPARYLAVLLTANSGSGVPSKIVAKQDRLEITITFGHPRLPINS